MYDVDGAFNYEIAPCSYDIPCILTPVEAIIWGFIFVAIIISRKGTA